MSSRARSWTKRERERNWKRRRVSIAMTEHDRNEEQIKRRPRIRVTDKRRLHTDESGAIADAGVEGGGSDRSGGSDPSVSEGATAARGTQGVGDGERAGQEGSEAENAKLEAAEYRDHLQRLQAEFANYRKRVLKEQTRAVEMAAEPLLRRLLEVLDEFDLALMAAERKPDFEQFLHGVELVYAKLQEILRSEGLERMDAEGKPFDPERHEALMQVHDGDGEPYVADVLRQGYTLRGRVIRPAGVKVGRK
jgi:molecular chaperone GrpE